MRKHTFRLLEASERACKAFLLILMISMTNASQDQATDNEPKRQEECKNIHNRNSKHTVGPNVHVGDRYITSMGQQENKNIK